MATFTERDPALYDELPYYFKTRRAAQEWADWQNETDDWGDETIVVRPAPDDVTVRDIDWDYDQ